MKKRIFFIFIVINLLLMTFVFGAEKELSVSVQVSEGNISDNVDSNNAGELGTFKGSIEEELTSSSNQNIIQKIFSNGMNGELLSVKVEKISPIFIFSFLAIFLFTIYVIFLVLRIKRAVKKRKKLSKYL